MKGLRQNDRLLRVLLDLLVPEVYAPFELVMPRDARALAVARAILARPADRLAHGGSRAGGVAAKRTIERIFLRETSLTLGRWQKEARLFRSLTELAAGEPVKAVARSVGYTSPSAFVLAFRKAFGVTPARYFR